MTGEHEVRPPRHDHDGRHHDHRPRPQDHGRQTYTPLNMDHSPRRTEGGPALPPKSPRMLQLQSSPIREHHPHPHQHQGDQARTGYQYPPHAPHAEPSGTTIGTPVPAPPPAPRSPLLERLRQTFVTREPMSRTWARKSYVDELDSLTELGDSERVGGGARSAPASVVGSGDLESQGEVLRSVILRIRQSTGWG